MQPTEVPVISPASGVGFFADSADDEDLERRNVVFWEAILDHIRRDGFSEAPRSVLDIGCHRGGLLARLAACWAPAELIGIEPLSNARARARLRLGTLAQAVKLLAPEEWGQVASGTVNLIVCHEVLFLFSDIEPLVEQLARVLTPKGRAYIAMGCHAENPIWPAWQATLEAQGIRTYTHGPICLMKLAGKHGLLASVRPLREGGWATHDPNEGTFTFSSVGALLDHQFKHKLLFRLLRP